ncbi:Methyltransferase domain-containing protein [Friedmanniella luteola]|uniref:Methyltransferase domain-containing protein n=1 Tax=Friedmanniella luteola TaxID=546871 RepID=A0A1H1ZUI9_9ACTN|nr:class I SAM-dependent methyltransferase [Friedmanniella luteola]SDT37333.1 Methyltransferase domain-containing protein [Friedmanniella luteola]
MARTTPRGLLGSVRSLVRSHWHHLAPLLALGALAAAVWAWVGEGSPALAALLVLQAALLVGVAVTGARSLTILRQGRRADQRLASVLTLSRKAARRAAPRPAPTPAAPPAPDLGPLLASLGMQRLDGAIRHEEVMEAYREVVRRQDVLAEGLQREKERREADIRRALEAWGPGVLRAPELQAAEERLTLLVNRKFEEAITENDALINLHRLVEVHHELPPAGGFAASPRTLLRLFSAASEVPADRLVVECGSGTSTVWLAEARRQAGGGHVVALEHDEGYAERTREAVRRSGLSAWVDVRWAPLEPVEIDGSSYRWYARSTWEDLAGIGLLFVDGPPGSVGPRSRHPAFPLLAARLADGATVALDDVQRPAERAIGQSWLADTTSPVVLTDHEVVGRTWFLRAERRPG